MADTAARRRGAGDAPHVMTAETPSNSRRRPSAGDVRSFLARRNWGFWIVLVAILVLWEVVANSVNSELIIVPLTKVAERAQELWSSGELLTDIRVSAEEFALGFAAGAIVGITMGLITGNWRSIGRVTDPFVSAIYATPIIALAPIFIISLGIGLTSKIVVVGLTAFFPTLLTTAAGVAATDAAYRELGRAFNLSEGRIALKIIVPSAIPHIVSGLRVATGRGLTAVLAAELFGAQAGVGLLILNAANQFDAAAVYVGIIIFAFAGVVLTKAFSVLERRIAPWREA